MADLENGLWAGNVHDYEGNPSQTGAFPHVRCVTHKQCVILQGEVSMRTLPSLYNTPHPYSV